MFILKIIPIILIFFTACSQPEYDVIIRGGIIYDGSGGLPSVCDVAIKADTIALIGTNITSTGKNEINAEGMAVSPGFINMLSWANESLIEDGRSQGDIRQGVTLEVLGEAWSMGPLNESMKKEMVDAQGDIKFAVEWTTLGEYLDFLINRGVSTNVASFIGATTVRIHEMGYDNRKPTPDELEKMQKLVSGAMEDGAVGVSTALIYPPGFYADTDELIALAKTSAGYGGMYISHLRSESNTLLESLNEFFTIAKESGARSEIYHLKAGGKENWHKLDEVIKRVEKARAEGLNVTADMYNYTAGATGLGAGMPPWCQEGGHDEWIKRLKKPETRKNIIKEMSTPTDKWENLYLAAGSAENVLLVGFKTEKLKPLTGKTLSEVAKMRNKSPEETAVDLVIEDDSDVGSVYFLMSEENVKKQIALPWVSFCSDAGSFANEGVFLKFSTHPRAYGCFSRLLGKYVRDDKIITLEEAVRKLTSLPAENLKIKKRGLLKSGYFADIVIFDPATIADHATYKEPHQYSTGMKHVFVNGIQVIKNGDHTGATPGRIVRGPGWKGYKNNK